MMRTVAARMDWSRRRHSDPQAWRLGAVRRWVARRARQGKGVGVVS